MERPGIRRSLAVGLLLATLTASPSLATQVRQLNLEHLTRKAGHIVAGRCTHLEVVEDAGLGGPVTLITIKVDRALKGDGNGTLRFRMAGVAPSMGRGPWPAGAPSFEPGEEVVLFLYPESPAGLTSPVGFGQGKFVVRRDKQNRPIALNGHGNRGLLEGLTPEARGRLGRRASLDRGARALGREELLDMVMELARQAETGP